jgi:hypothetical protein
MCIASASLLLTLHAETIDGRVFFAIDRFVDPTQVVDAPCADDPEGLALELQTGRPCATSANISATA